MPAFSHFFLKRLSARSKFSSSWIMTSDKFYFPPSWRLAAPACVQIAKPSGRRRMGQANRPLCGRIRELVEPRALEHCRCVGRGGGIGDTLARAEPLRALLRSAQSWVSWSLAEVAVCPHPVRLPCEIQSGDSHLSRASLQRRAICLTHFDARSPERAERSSASPRLKGGRRMLRAAESVVRG